MTQLYNSILNFVASLLPNSDGFSDPIESSFTTVFAYINDFDFIIPVGTIINVLQAIVTFELLMLGWNLTRYILNLVRGASA